MELICLETETFYMLIEQVVLRIKEKQNNKEERWLSPQQTMELLHISKSTLQRMRNEGKIRFSQLAHKTILYDRDSIIEYLEKHVKERF